MDFAKRAFDHSHHIDPIVRSLLDTDFYKLLMLQFIRLRYPDAEVTFAVANRTQSVHLADEIPIEEVRAQLDHVRTLRFKPSEIVWLRGQTFYGERGIFAEEFLAFLASLEMPEYVLERGPDGQFRLEFPGKWTDTTLWEIYALAILAELRGRAVMKRMNRSALDIMYARAKVKLYDKLARLRASEGLNLIDFGTRRRHSHPWQEHCILTAAELLGSCFTGTSNAYFAMKHDMEARGTNAHELPMVIAALASDDAALKSSQYRVLEQWQEVYPVPALKVMLPDTFGTTQFLRDAPDWLSHWTGGRPDSKKPMEGGEELLDYWRRVDPEHAAEKIIIFSDGMDVHLPGQPPQGEDIATVHDFFRGRVRAGFGWGTNLTNDFVGCPPGDPDAMRALSLVCKVKDANGRPAVKLSDNYRKAVGPPDEVERYRRVFGIEGLTDIPVVV
jgi:nicotinate phosphoribosyltransferase